MIWNGYILTVSTMNCTTFYTQMKQDTSKKVKCRNMIIAKRFCIFTCISFYKTGITVRQIYTQCTSKCVFLSLVFAPKIILEKTLNINDILNFSSIIFEPNLCPKNPHFDVHWVYHKKMDSLCVCPPMPAWAFPKSQPDLSLEHTQEAQTSPGACFASALQTPHQLNKLGICVNKYPLVHPLGILLPFLKKKIYRLIIQVVVF